MHTVQSCTLVGIDVQPVQVEVDLLSRLPRVVIVGLQATQAQETAERVRSAIVASGFEFPRCRVIVNLAPADLRKDGAGLDLPIAIGILAATGQYEVPAGAVFLGELALDGRIRPTRADFAAKLKYGAALRGPGHADLAAVVAGHAPQAPAVDVERSPRRPDFADVCGDLAILPGLIEAARTGRPLVFVGPPGCGKCMIALRFAGLLAPPTGDVAADLGKIYAAAGLSWNGGVPFRAPHHTVAVAGMIGDRRLRPGEATLAHGGVLFLDEAQEFARPVLEALRPVVRDQQVSVALFEHTVRLPAAFRLVLSVNDAAGLDRVKRGLGSILDDAIVVTLDKGAIGSIGAHREPWPSTAELRAKMQA